MSHFHWEQVTVQRRCFLSSQEDQQGQAALGFVQNGSWQYCVKALMMGTFMYFNPNKAPGRSPAASMSEESEAPSGSGRVSEPRVPRELIVLLDVQLLVRLIRHVRIQLGVGLLRRHGAPTAAGRRRLRARHMLSLVRALDSGRIGGLFSVVTPPGGPAVLQLPLSSLRNLLVQIQIDSYMNWLHFISK